MSIQERVLNETAAVILATTNTATIERLRGIRQTIAPERSTDTFHAHVRDVTRRRTTHGSVDDVAEVVEGVVAPGNAGQLTLDGHVDFACATRHDDVSHTTTQIAAT